MRHFRETGHRVWRWAAIAAAALTWASGCSSPPVELVESRLAMDTEVMVRVVAPDEKVARRALDAAWQELDRCAALLDRHRKGSDVDRINQAAGRWHVEVDPLVTTCLAAAREAYELTGGAFDPTIGPLTDLWRQAAAQNRLPTDDEISKTLALVGMDKVEVLVAPFQRSAQDLPFAPPGAGPPTVEEITRMAHSVGLRAGMSLDLGGIAKGYIAGRMARRLQQAGAAAGLVAAAGDVYALGERPRSLVGPGRDTRWGVAVLDPRFPDDRSKFYTAVRVRNQGVDTSGHYYRGHTIQGRRFSHIIDPRTGRPVDTLLASVTVVADDPAISDALATAIAVLGVREGLALVEKTDGVECLILEAVLKEGQPPQPNGAPPPDAELVAHRSSGFAALEFNPRND